MAESTVTTKGRMTPVSTDSSDLPDGNSSKSPDTTFDRIRRGRNRVVTPLAVGITLFHIGVLAFIPLDPWLFLGFSANLFCVLVYISLPLNPVWPQTSLAIDVLLSAAAVGVMAYLWLNVNEMYYRVGFNPTTADVVAGTAAIILVLETARRTLGMIFPALGAIFLLYALYGNIFPGIWGHRGYEYSRMISTVFSTEGLYGFAMNAAASYIVLFVTFGAFMEATGIGEFFIRFANAIAGRSRGGAAKVCVVASALFGTISGSSMGNVVTTGTFTIPLMKRAGYSATFAGGVEAAASTGGQIMPPLMGAVAFVLADATQTPYREVMLAAAIPALCYFMTVFFVTDFEALKQGLKGEEGDMPSVRQILKEDWPLLVPIILLLVMIVVLQRSITQSALLSILAAIVVDMIRKRRLLNLQMIWNGLARGSQLSIQAAAACAAAGVLVGVFGLTGLGNRFVMVATGLSGDFLIPAMIMVMLLTLMMGFPLPTVPAYVITGMIGAPVIVKLAGVEPLVAHLFVLYYACVSTITPPVGLAAFAAAGIAGADPYRTAFAAMRLGLAAYVIPFVFVFNQHLLGFGTWYEVSAAVVTALAASYALACSINSDYHKAMRLVIAAIAVPLIWPNLALNAAALIALIVLDYFGRKTSKSGGSKKTLSYVSGPSNPSPTNLDDGSASAKEKPK